MDTSYSYPLIADDINKVSKVAYANKLLIDNVLLLPCCSNAVLL